jgi:HEPN domain-containing protein
MTENDSLIPAEWYEIAARDRGAAKALLKDRDEFLPVAGMLLQQAVEKYIKGYLLSKGWRLDRTHANYARTRSSAQAASPSSGTSGGRV